MPIPDALCSVRSVTDAQCYRRSLTIALVVSWDLYRQAQDRIPNMLQQAKPGAASVLNRPYVNHQPRGQCCNTHGKTHCHAHHPS